MCAQIEDEGLNAEDPVLEEDLPPEPEPEPEIGIRSTRTQRVIYMVYIHVLYQTTRGSSLILTALRKDAVLCTVF